MQTLQSKATAEKLNHHIQNAEIGKDELIHSGARNLSNMRVQTPESYSTNFDKRISATENRLNESIIVDNSHQKSTDMSIRSSHHQERYLETDMFMIQNK